MDSVRIPVTCRLGYWFAHMDIARYFIFYREIKVLIQLWSAPFEKRDKFLVT